MKASDLMHFKLPRFCGFSLTSVSFLDIKFTALLTIPNSIQYEENSALLQYVVNSGIRLSGKVPDHTKKLNKIKSFKKTVEILSVTMCILISR